MENIPYNKEFIGYTSNDIEIFITAYEITAPIKQTRAYRAHPLLLGQKSFGTETDRGLMQIKLKIKERNTKKISNLEVLRSDSTEKRSMTGTNQPGRLSKLSDKSQSVIYLLANKFHCYNKY